ncbi:peptidylprolyl isomerase [Rhizohabitans arisaemae]|uniref:peptidylprolyl isomerase n=1 Tax=Rhizohabitans arisaemae TaxID=2720610 RepID=UPI0024B05BDA|nr:peptidylprolyl isomerase [Rhizohabitans arisaemae]
MTGEDSKSQLAREHNERKLKRERNKSRRAPVIAAVTTVVLVVGAVVGWVALGGDSEAKPLAASSPTPSVTTPSLPPTPTPPGQVRCEYPAETVGTIKKVGTPPAKPVSAKTMTVVTNHGTIVIELDAKNAPCTVNSFVHLAKKNFFDNTPCYRLTQARTSALDVLQCGDPFAKGDGNEKDGTGNPDYRVADEALGTSDYAVGTVAMLNNGEPNTNGSQFFVVHGEFPVENIGANNTPFGKVVKGMDIIHKIAAGGNTIPEKEHGEQGPTPPKIPLIVKDLTVSRK